MIFKKKNILKTPSNKCCILKKQLYLTECFIYLKENIIIKQKVIFLLKKSYFLRRKYYDIKRKCYDIRQVSLIFSKESNKFPNGVPIYLFIYLSIYWNTCYIELSKDKLPYLS